MVSKYITSLSIVTVAILTGGVVASVVTNAEGTQWGIILLSIYAVALGMAIAHAARILTRPSEGD